MDDETIEARVEEVDPDWRQHFADIDLAWSFYFEPKQEQLH